MKTWMRHHRGLLLLRSEIVGVGVFSVCKVVASIWAVMLSICEIVRLVDVLRSNSFVVDLF